MERLPSAPRRPARRAPARAALRAPPAAVGAIPDLAVAALGQAVEPLRPLLKDAKAERARGCQALEAIAATRTRMSPACRRRGHPHCGPWRKGRPVARRTGRGLCPTSPDVSATRTSRCASPPCTSWGTSARRRTRGLRRRQGAGGREPVRALGRGARAGQDGRRKESNRRAGAGTPGR